MDIGIGLQIGTDRVRWEPSL